MRVDDEGRLEGIAVAILDHLRRYPQAADSPSGVARWWLGAGYAGVAVEDVERALDLLVARHAMRRLNLMDGTALYLCSKVSHPSHLPPT